LWTLDLNFKLTKAKQYNSKKTVFGFFGMDANKKQGEKR